LPVSFSFPYVCINALITCYFHVTGYCLFIVRVHICLQLWDELTGQGKLLQDGVRAVEDGVKVVGEKIKFVEEEVRSGVRSLMEGVECFLSFTPPPVRVRSA
jgi:hypothetical protein